MVSYFFALALLASLSFATASDASSLAAEGRADASSGRRTVAVALMHRHGARTGPQISPAGLQWGNAVLSPVGAEMALALGGWLRHHYTQAYNDSQSSGIFCAPDPLTGEIPLSTSRCIGRDYSVKQVVSQSTLFERTIRTGMGLLRGMFANDSYAIPFIDHSPTNIDMKLGYYYSWPSAMMHTESIVAYNPDHDEQTLALMTQEELDEVGAALQSTSRCHTQQTLCILLAQDVTSCNYANNPQDPDSPGRIAEALSKYWPKFRMAQQRSNAFLYMYNNPSQQPDSYKQNRTRNPKNLLQSEALWERTGAFGRVFTREVGARFRERLNAFRNDDSSNKAGAGLSPLLYHYSAHDVTIYGVQVAMGGITVTDMYAPTDSPWPEGSAEYDEMTSFLIPEFASVLMFDLYEDGNVSVSFAKPPQVYGSNFSNYTVLSNKVVRMTCMRADGALYRTQECPIDDFVRYTDYMKPTPSFTSVSLPPQSQQEYDNYDSYSYCYALEEDIMGTGCGTSNTSVPSDPNCVLYRTVCPSFACDSPRYVLNRSTLACVDMQAPADTNQRYRLLHGSSKWFYAGTVLGSLLLGLIIGFVVRVALWERGARQQKADDDLADILNGGHAPSPSGAKQAGKVYRQLATNGSVTDSMATAKEQDAEGRATPPEQSGRGATPAPRETERLQPPASPVIDQGAVGSPASPKFSPVGSQMASMHTTPANVAEKQPEGGNSLPSDRPPLQIF